MRHVEDGGASEGSLRNVELAQTRDLANKTDQGAFRPLKCAPNLQRGWRLPLKDAAELEEALARLLPGALADWFAAQSPTLPVTHYRQFTNRQTGMYRITQTLSDAQAAEAIRAACDARFCLKRRLWTVEGLEGDEAKEKSAVPCLEPCAVFLEFARKATRIQQEEKTGLELAESELETVREALKLAMETASGLREGDTNAPLNARRIGLLLNKLPERTAPETSE